MVNIIKLLRNERFIFVLYTVTGVGMAIDRFLAGPLLHNNFRIFSSGFAHLVAHQNLHLEYPAEYFDLFLYNPSFCILFAPFSMLPPALGLCLWLLISSIVIFISIKMLPVSSVGKVFCWWFIYFELFKSLHSQQTNPVLAAAGLFTFVFLERGKLHWAALFPVLAFCIKGYGLAFAALCLFYPGRWRYLVFTARWMLLFIVLPLPFTGFRHFIQAYLDWFAILVQDRQVNYGYSIMGVLKVWFPGLTVGGAIFLQFLGVALLGVTWLVLLQSKRYQALAVRLRVLAYLLLWVIVFNHVAEHPTYIIAACGVALYYVVNRGGQSVVTNLLVACAFAGSIFSRLDIYSESYLGQGFEPFLIKVIPYALIWGVLQFQLLWPERSQNGVVQAVEAIG